ncbi:hypothetical protein [Brevibacterium album]|uniref:hypothetical protein n=1 Tax=Brevibacterium album TaxID=417948 RepID=UPI000404D220|nr:hypothetical protein [Brevibacterium album]
MSQPWEDHRLFSGLTCTEAESLAEVFRALGADAVARHVIEAHAAGDNEPDDQHHDLFLVLERGE